MSKRAGNQFGDVQVALFVLHQQDQTRDGQTVCPQSFQHNLRTQQGFNALAPCLFIQLDGTKQIGPVGNGQRGLAVLGGGFDDLVYAASGVNHGKLGVKAQVYKHDGIVGRRSFTLWAALPPSISGNRFRADGAGQ